MATSFNTVADKFGKKCGLIDKTNVINWEGELKPVFTLVNESSVIVVNGVLSTYINCQFSTSVEPALNSISDKNVASVIREQFKEIYSSLSRINLLGNKINLHIIQETTGKSEIINSAEKRYEKWQYQTLVTADALAILNGLRDIQRLYLSKYNQFSLQIDTLNALQDEFTRGTSSVLNSITTIALKLNPDNMVGLITDLGAAIDEYKKTLKKTLQYVNTADKTISEFYVTRNLIVDILLGLKKIHVIKPLVAALPN